MDVVKNTLIVLATIAAVAFGGYKFWYHFSGKAAEDKAMHDLYEAQSRYDHMKDLERTLKDAAGMR